MKTNIKFIIPLVLIIVFMLILLPKSISKTFTESDKAFGNPFMGYAPMAEEENVPDDITLLYAGISWAELEPCDGEYDFDAIESKYQFKRWKNAGKNIVLRFLCDTPSDYAHMDIPEWLYDKTGDGTIYDTSYGKGYSPDYENATFIKHYKQAVNALGERYGNDDFIKFVELGGLGHWGEWHVKYSDGIARLPKRDIRNEYITPWIDAFPDSYILMRRPFAEAEEFGLGLYNDVTGDKDETDKWLDWIENGGECSQTKEKNGLVPMHDFWLNAPCGGELTSSIPMEEMLCDNLDETISLIKKSHQTFLGPKIAEKEYQNGYDKLLTALGYRLWFSKVEFKESLFNGLIVNIKWHNTGSAPFYDDWRIYVYVYDKNRSLIERVQCPISTKAILPDKNIEISTKLSSVRKLRNINDFIVAVGIENPNTNENGIRLAMDNLKTIDDKIIISPIVAQY